MTSPPLTAASRTGPYSVSRDPATQHTRNRFWLLDGDGRMVIECEVRDVLDQACAQLNNFHRSEIKAAYAAGSAAADARMREACEEVLPLMAGWREVIAELDDMPKSEALAKAMYACLGQIDRMKVELRAALAASGRGEAS